MGGGGGVKHLKRWKAFFLNPQVQITQEKLELEKI